MKYESVTEGVFISRPNRFIARVLTGGREETVHVKNTGRCRELLIPGARVWLSPGKNPGRKTAFDLIAVRKESGLLVNIDSQAPNAVALEWLRGQGYSKILPEYAFGESRIDFYMERGNARYLMEVKGCTLEEGGVGYFPDAPTQRGIKHLRELGEAARRGINAALCFVIQMEGVTEVRPNTATHPEFGEELEKARSSGVKVIYLPCRVTPDSVTAV